MLVDEANWGELTSATKPANAAFLLAAATGTIVRHCGWPIERTIVVDDVIDSPGGRLLRLPTLHLVSVEEVQVDGSVVTDYRWSRKGMLQRDACWPEGFSRLTVSYTHGYDPVPADVQALVVSLALRSGDISSVGLKRETVGQMTREFGDGVTLELNRIDEFALDAYRLEPA